ncbi:MAG: hypothetical protein ACE5IL_12730 [Myxococcota bacterium]
MQRVLYLLILAAMLVGYYEGLGPGPGPSDLIEDLEWWRPAGFAHTWALFAGLERLAEGGGRGALVALGLFWLPAVAMLAWGLRLFRSAILRTWATTSFLLLLILSYYGYLAEGVWRFFEWRSVAVAATFAGVVASALFAPSLVRGALARSRVWTALALAGTFAGVFLLSTEITGTNSEMRFNLSPWPVVTLFGLLLIGSAIATFHVAAGLGTWLAARLGGPRGLTAGALAAALVAAALTPAVLHDPGAGALVAASLLSAGYAVARCRLGPKGGAEAARRGLQVAAAGAFVFLAIQVSNRAAIVFQTTARNRTATQVLVAVEAYRKAHGSYPDHLRDLVPEFFKEVPRPRIGLILDDDDRFLYRNLGDSYLLEFNSVEWVQCGYSPPYDVAEYSDEDSEDEAGAPEYDLPEGFGGGDDEGSEQAKPMDPDLKAVLADFGLEGAWNCENAPPKLW